MLNTHSLLSSALLILLSVCVNADPFCPDAVRAAGVGRKQFVRQFLKDNLPVPMKLSDQHRRELDSFENPERAKNIFRRFRTTKAVRDMLIADFRGSATTVTIIIREVLELGDTREPIVVIRNAKGDPRTVLGKETVLLNVQIAEAHFRNLKFSQIVASIR